MTNLSLHPKHGLNPSLATCFWCGKDRGELMLLGNNKGKKAPHRAVYDYEPCDSCKECMSLGVTIIEASSEKIGAPPIQEGCYPTGRWWVVKREAIAVLFEGFSGIGSIKDRVLIEVGMAEHMGLSSEETKQ